MFSSISLIRKAQDQDDAQSRHLRRPCAAHQAQPKIVWPQIYILSLMMLVFALSPTSASAQSCKTPIDARAWQAHLDAITTALESNEFSQARALALDGQRMLTCVNTPLTARSIAILPYNAALATWYLSEGESQTRRFLHEALILDPEIPKASDESEEFQRILEDERSQLKALATYDLIPTFGQNARVWLNGYPVEGKRSLYAGTHLVQIETASRTLCSAWLTLSALSGVPETRYLRLETGKDSGQNCDQDVIIADRAPIPKSTYILGGAALTSIAAVASSLALNQQYESITAIYDATHINCDGAIEAECAKYKRSFIRSWALIGTSALLWGVGAKMWKDHRTQVGVAILPDEITIQASLTFGK